ncbi:unnamed protein product [Euphydryas editha]|uniref:Uncharacterized protein n=1 Tax=Euphydryas editha TaxID=104508 RepID=A0AAU9VEL6_EUPED|nr:unnamed protein product [Euphydryas editha]
MPVSVVAGEFQCVASGRCARAPRAPHGLGRASHIALLQGSPEPSRAVISGDWVRRAAGCCAVIPPLEYVQHIQMTNRHRAPTRCRTCRA